MGRKLGDGSYVPAPAQPPEQQRVQLDQASSSATQDNTDAGPAANEGTIAEFDLPKILRHIKELNYLVRRCSLQQLLVVEVLPLLFLSWRFHR